MKTENISAIATAPGRGGVAIIRVSGSSALSLASKMFNPSGKIKVEDFEPNKMYPGTIVAEGFTDYGMCVYFKAPKSFTGEDTIELHCHGGVHIARGILMATVAKGARLATAGEFTKRAFLNGKLSLASAEGMVDMINAQSLAEVRAGRQMYTEQLTNKIIDIQSKLTDILAGISADIDYPEEDVESTELYDVKERMQRILGSIESLLTSYYSCGKRIKEGVNVAICGKPNVGKSSLLNRLLGYDKAIVSSTAGTTRDIVEGSIELDGVRYNLFDTAGIRQTDGEIENIGIRMAERTLAAADAVLFLTDLSLDDEEVRLRSLLEGLNVIRVFNKCDIYGSQSGVDINISAKTGEGIDELKAQLVSKCMDGYAQDGSYVLEERHANALQRAKTAVENALSNMDYMPLDMISTDLRNCWEILGEITGQTANEDIINTVFAKFCVGK